jgi:putative addiction module killer protein
LSEPRERKTDYYATAHGDEPFRNWRSGLTDKRLKVAVDSRIGRLRLGNFGNSRHVGEGAFENKIDYGLGYRIYYGVNGDTEVVLLCGGDKTTQESDIAKAKLYLADHRKRVWEKKKN